MKIMGEHYLIEFLGCDEGLIDLVDRVKPVLVRAVEDCGATAVTYAFHQFEPVGVSATVLLTESHFCLHTWPEHGYVAADVFTCGELMVPETAISILAEGFRAERVEVEKHGRGIS